MTQNGTNKKLTPKQIRAIEAMMTSPTVRGAAQVAGIGHSTLYRWIEEPAFAEALREAKEQAFARVMTALTAAAEKAVEVLRTILDDEEAAEKPGASIRMRAVRVALDSMLRSHDLIEVEQRLRRVEEILLQRGTL
jgi:hypothetical protein